MLCLSVSKCCRNYARLLFCCGTRVVLSGLLQGLEAWSMFYGGVRRLGLQTAEANILEACYEQRP